MSAEIYIENEQTGFAVTKEIEKIITDVINEALKYEAFPYDCEVDVLLTNDTEIHALNKEHRNIDRSTDVLSFPMLNFDENGNIIEDESIFPDDFVMLGDIVISMDTAMRQAEEYGHSPMREIGFLCAHSMLHLMGYDHEDSEESRLVMHKKEEEILNRLGLVRG